MILSLHTSCCSCTRNHSPKLLSHWTSLIFSLSGKPIISIFKWRSNCEIIFRYCKKDSVRFTNNFSSILNRRRNSLRLDILVKHGKLWNLNPLEIKSWIFYLVYSLNKSGICWTFPQGSTNNSDFILKFILLNSLKICYFRLTMTLSHKYFIK